MFPLWIFLLCAQWGGHWGTVWQQRRQTLLACLMVRRCKCKLDPHGTPRYLEALSLPQTPHKDIKTQPVNLLCSGLALKSPSPTPALMSWSHLCMSGLDQVLPNEREGRTGFYSWTDGQREQKRRAALKPLSFALAGHSLHMICFHKASSQLCFECDIAYKHLQKCLVFLRPRESKQLAV